MPTEQTHFKAVVLPDGTLYVMKRDPQGLWQSIHNPNRRYTLHAADRSPNTGGVKIRDPLEIGTPDNGALDAKMFGLGLSPSP